MFFHRFISMRFDLMFLELKNATHLSQHDSLKNTYAHAMTLWVTSGAHHSNTHFRILIVSLKYIVITMPLETHIAQTSLCAMFGARLCSILLGILGPILGQLKSQDRSRTSGRATSVGGSAMHMQIPDDIERKAGIGSTQTRKEKLSRAYPC